MTIDRTIYDAICMERARQETLRRQGKFDATCATTGKAQMSEFKCYTVLGEEFGEVGRALLEHGAIASDPLIAELIQTAAVCVAWLERLLSTERQMQ